NSMGTTRDLALTSRPRMRRALPFALRLWILRFRQDPSGLLEQGHRDHEGKPRKENQMRTALQAPKALLRQSPPARQRWLHAKPQKGEGALRDDGLRDLKQDGDEDRAAHRGDEMLEQEPRGRRAAGAR